MVYYPGISGSPDAQSMGSGDVWVFSGGHKVHGTWTRADRLQAVHPDGRRRHPDPAHPRAHVHRAASVGARQRHAEVVAALVQRVPPPSTSMRCPVT